MWWKEYGIRSHRQDTGLFLEPGAGGDPAGGGGGGAPGGQSPAGGGDPGGGGDPAAGGAGSVAWHENAGWYESLPEALKESASSLEGLKGKPIGEVLAEYVKKSSESAPPASPREYGIALPKALADAATDDQARAGLQATFDGMLSTAHALGMSKAQAQAYIDGEAKTAIAELETARQETLAAEKALKEKWGGKYDGNVVLVQRAIASLPEDLQKIVTSAGIGSHPHFIELIHTLGEARAEGRMHQGDPGGSTISDGQMFYPGSQPK